MFEAMKLAVRPATTSQHAQCRAVLAYDPGNMDHMVSIPIALTGPVYYGTACGWGNL